MNLQRLLIHQTRLSTWQFQSKEADSDFHSKSSSHLTCSSLILIVEFLRCLSIQSYHFNNFTYPFSNLIKMKRIQEASFWLFAINKIFIHNASIIKNGYHYLFVSCILIMVNLQLSIITFPIYLMLTWNFPFKLIEMVEIISSKFIPEV